MNNTVKNVKNSVLVQQLLRDKQYVHMYHYVLVCPNSLTQFVLKAFYSKILVSLPQYFQWLKTFVWISSKFENTHLIAADDDSADNSCFQSSEKDDSFNFFNQMIWRLGLRLLSTPRCLSHWVSCGTHNVNAMQKQMTMRIVGLFNDATSYYGHRASDANKDN